MRSIKHQVTGQQRRPGRQLRLWAGVAALSTGALVAGVLATAGTAYADVTSSPYTIGAPSGAVTGVTVTPTGAPVSTETNFEVTFLANPALSASSSDWVSIMPSQAFNTTPSNVDLVGTSCVQGNAGGGSVTPSGITIELASSCSVASGSKVEVDFEAETPASPGAFNFSVTTSRNSTPATSNSVTLSNSGPALTAISQGFGANTTYTVSGLTVSGVGGGGTTTVTLTAQPTSGGTITFVNSSTGAGYSVIATPSGGSATSDTVTNATSSGATVVLTLANAIVSGDTLSITAIGQNPSTNPSSDDILVQPGGGGSPQTTSVLTFGGTPTSLSVVPSSTVATAAATYTVAFRASDAVSTSGDIFLSEKAGPTNFSTVSGVEVVDTTQNWHFVATGASLSPTGTATIPLSDPISAGDSVSMILVGVTNPSTAGTISDFQVWTTGDPVPATAPGYAIGNNASPGVVVTVNPSTAGQIATYSIANLQATASLTGGTAVIKLEAPPGTTFPNNPSFYTVDDLTTASGSGTVTAALTGGGTNTVTLTVPNTINSGDQFTVTIADVLNPSTASSSDTITVVNSSVTGPAAVAVTTTTTSTTTTVPTTTTTTKPPVKKPAIADLSIKQVSVSSRGGLSIKLHCTVKKCEGHVTLVDVRTLVAQSKFSLSAGKTGTVQFQLHPNGMFDIKHAKHHTITVHVTITVSGGNTVKVKTALVG
ncbi:MAG TPA: hypothetical protein VME46_11025 [Acidimicrobiales bacterium]|nr:hypothetical protein [Acidimicrobiales bacterium]